MELTDLHWKAFALCDQDTKSLSTTAEIMGISRQEVEILMADIRRAGLCPHRSDRNHFGQQMSGTGRKLLRIDDIDESDIREKF